LVEPTVTHGTAKQLQPAPFGPAEDAVIERHEANGMLFGAFFDKPGFREMMLEYLGGAYDEIRAGS